jgi:hypothetical protein
MIIDVSDSFTSRDLADDRIGPKRFNPADNRSATRLGIAIVFSFCVELALMPEGKTGSGGFCGVEFSTTP